ncbi:MAG: cytochrome P450, partial [Acidimicrobiia bacterium]|nr:cytochrome P450 [Acidimicrobiia bacterium]
NAANFEWAPAFRVLEVVDGPTALVLSDGADHKRRRRLVQPAFSMKRIDAHLGVIVEELDRALDGWTTGRRFRAYDDLRVAVRRIVLRTLFGDLLADRADEVGELLGPALTYVQRTPFTRFDRDLRVNAYARAVRGVRAADAVISAEVARRRAHGVDADEHPDVLSALLVGAEDDQLTDAEVLDQVRSLIAAGYDTTSAAAAWIAHELGRRPDVLRALRDEVDAVLGDRPPTLDDLRRLPTVDGVVREVLRLWPPGFVAGRRSVADCEIAGRSIPGGSMVLYSAYVTGRDPELWPEPERFDPARWAPGAPEPAPYSFVPFGGGARRCIGFALATLELQVLVTRLAQRARWRLERADTKAVGIASAVPKGGVPITVL